MVAYIISHINVLILRKRLPKAPRNFKMPLVPFTSIVGILGTIWMIYNIDSSDAVRLRIYSVCLIIFAALAVYSVIWIKKVMKKPLFKALPLKDVMAMENDLYQEYHKASKKINDKSNKDKSAGEIA